MVTHKSQSVFVRNGDQITDFFAYHICTTILAMQVILYRDGIDVHGACPIHPSI